MIYRKETYFFCQTSLSVCCQRPLQKRSGVLSCLSSVLRTYQEFTSGYVNVETILYFFYKITNRRKRKCSEKLLVYYVNKDLNSPENRHDPISFALLNNYCLSNAALVVVETTEIDDLCKKNNGVYKQSLMKKLTYKDLIFLPEYSSVHAFSVQPFFVHFYLHAVVTCCIMQVPMFFKQSPHDD